MNLLFAFFSLAYAAAIMGARASYLADTLDEFATGVQVATFFAAVGFPLLAWFVAVYTRVRPRVLLLITRVFAVVAFARLHNPQPGP